MRIVPTIHITKSNNKIVINYLRFIKIIYFLNLFVRDLMIRIYHSDGIMA